MPLFLLFLAVPLIEIALFIQVGGLIGLWPTLGIVVLTAIAGTWLVRSQGFAALGQLQQSFSELRDPTEPLAHGAMILFAGALLLTPGFFTDAVGFLLLIPSFRLWVMREAGKRIKTSSIRFETHGSAGPTNRRRPGPGASRPDIIDGEYEEVDPPHRPTHSSSGWTRH